MEIGKDEDVSFVTYGLDLCTYLLPFSILSTLHGIPHPFTKARKGEVVYKGFLPHPLEHSQLYATHHQTLISWLLYA